jgi:hypothetical protein
MVESAIELAPVASENSIHLTRGHRSAGRRADIDREHAADPDDGAECVKGEGEGGHEEGSRFEALQRLHAGLCEPWQAAAQSAGSPLTALEFISFGAHIGSEYGGAQHASNRANSGRQDVLLSSLWSTLFGDVFAAFQE